MLDVDVVFGLVVKLYALMTPTGVLSAFIANTHDFSRRERYHIACKTSLAMFIIGELLLLFGAPIFTVFGFTLDAFRIGVGVLLFLSAINLMNDSAPSAHRRGGGDISIVPLAIPLGMGPASIGTLMVLGASAHGSGDLLSASLALFLASLGMLILLCFSGPVEKLLGKPGIAVMAKLTALLLSALAAQVIFSGIKGFLKLD